jgi:hypothetical protein
MWAQHGNEQMTATPNDTLERIENRCWRIVLAIDGVLADAQWR